MKAIFRMLTDFLYLKNLHITWGLIVFSIFTTSGFGQNNLSIRKGQVLDTVKCINFKEHSYALYIPSNYNESKKWPVIFVFDPAANGKRPTTLFKNGAEKYGYIIAASNNSKNGPWNDSFLAAEKMFEDVEKRFNIDKTRMYLSGFSGGARLAVAIASLTKQFSGVIACGAGFPHVTGFDPYRNAPYIYIGLFGNQDINYLEVNEIETAISQLNLTGCVHIFEGTHQWAPPELLSDAIEWIETEAMAKALLPVNKKFTEEQLKKTILRIDQAKQKGDILEASRTLRELITTFKPLLDVEKYEKQLQKLKTTNEYLASEKKQNNLTKTETNTRIKYSKAFTELQSYNYKTDSIMHWFESEIKSLHRQCETTDSDYRNMAKRLINNLTFYFTEKGSEYITQENYLMAIKMFQLWSCSEPSNKMACLNLAKLYLIQGDENKAVKEIEKSFSLGLTVDLLNHYPEFKQIQNNKRFLKIKSELEK